MTLERRLAIAIAALAVALSVNDALPYVGAKDDSCQTMFCGLDWSERSNNHFFLPQRALTDHWASYETRAVRISPAPAEGELRYVAEWLADESRDKGTEATRAAIDRLCAGGHEVSLELRRLDRGERFTSFDDACAEPSLRDWSRWVPVRLFDTDSRPFEAPAAGVPE